MKALYHIVTCVLLFIPSLEAQERGVAIRSCGSAFIETEPRSIVTAAFHITNETSERQELCSEVELPPKWMLIGEDPFFTLSPNEGAVRLVSFLVPQRTLAGKYGLTYYVTERKCPCLRNFHSVDVRVLPVRKLEVDVLAAPDLVIAGEDYHVSFMVTNRSNTESDVSVSINSGENLPFTTDAEKFKLASGESRALEVVVKTDAKRRGSLKHFLRLTAQAFEDQEIKGQATSHVDVLPRIVAPEERFHKIPTNLTFTYVTGRNEQDNAGFQAAISGSGTIDEEGKRQVDFVLQGPDVQDKSIFGQHDEYRLYFRTKYAELRLGDQIYAVSPLIERYSYGRGIEGRLALGDVRIGTYHMKTRWLEREEKHTAGTLDYVVGENLQLGLNYLHREKENRDEDIASVECRLHPLRDTDCELEYATGRQSGERGDAYQLGISSRWNWISCVSRFAHAEPGAPAHQGNRDFVSAGLFCKLKHNLKLSINLHQEKQNLDLEPTLSSAPLEKSCKLGCDYRFRTGTSFYAYWRERRREDRLPVPEFRYREKTILLGAEQSFHPIGFHITAESGKRDDELRDQSPHLKRYKIYAHFKPTHRLSSSGYLYSDDNGDFSQENRRRITAGLNSSLRIADKTHLSLTFQIDHYGGSHEGNKDIFEMNFRHSFPNQSEVRIRGRRLVHGNLKRRYEGALMVEYTIPFGLPTTRKKGVGWVTGCVFDDESHKPMSDVILRLNGTTAITDETGKFSFPAVTPGSQYLSVSTARIGQDKITLQKTPREVIIRGGEQMWVEMAVTRSASLGGQVMLYRFEKSSSHNSFEEVQRNHHIAGEDGGQDSGPAGESRLVEVSGIPNILVELKNGGEVIRCLTDAEGCFQFEGIRPGQWTMKIHQDHLPNCHYLDQDILNLELKPGQEKQVLVKVLPKMRSIQIIEQGRILLEEESGNP